MAHSTDQSPALMTQDLPLSVAGRGPREFPKPPVHVTLPPTARTTTRQKPSPSSQAQSPITSEGQLLALDNFFGPAPQRQRSVDIEKQSSEPRNIFEREKEPETVSKYLFYYGFIFPPFWLFGACILFVGSRSLSDSRPTSAEVGAVDNPRSSMLSQGGTRRSRRLLSLHMQITERRWSFRCLYAWVTLVVCIVGLVVGLWAARVGSFADR
ncbi:hypothetical protein RSOLAG1IB_08071 [Rhizoctonia solani AG-1 IB]|uniref:Transmembrane protein n=1 Tax=Thanatephorus cucumeris (strain AG1-IB / isolate 7/3/14) TaxID=1108050 RepID=A0A0B7FIL2_THACB|nr:hypothetical protein RSOLAG1IB_08071 [Rhizoctonia solani AG-1 IB]